MGHLNTRNIKKLQARNKLIIDVKAAVSYALDSSNNDIDKIIIQIQFRQRTDSLPLLKNVFCKDFYNLNLYKTVDELLAFIRNEYSLDKSLWSAYLRLETKNLTDKIFMSNPIIINDE